MSDLVEQLKKYHREVVASDEGECGGMALVREAYTEIERLRAELEKARTEYAELDALRHTACDQRDQYKARLVECRKILGTAITALRGEAKE